MAQIIQVSASRASAPPGGKRLLGRQQRIPIWQCKGECETNARESALAGAVMPSVGEAMQSRARRAMDCIVASAFARRRASADKRVPRKDGG